MGWAPEDGARVQVQTPLGTNVGMDATTAAKSRLTPESQESVEARGQEFADKREYGGVSLRGSGEAIARGVSGGLSDVAMVGLGADAEGIRKRQQHGTGTTLLETGAAIGSALASGGTGLLGKAAALTPAGALAKGSMAVAKGGGLVRGAAAGAMEGAALATGYAAADVALSEEPMSAEVAFAHIGKSALFGGLVGGAAGGLVGAAERSLGRRAAKYADDTAHATPAKAVARETAGEIAEATAQGFNKYETSFARHYGQAESLAGAVKQEAKMLRDYAGAGTRTMRKAEEALDAARKELEDILPLPKTGLPSDPKGARVKDPGIPGNAPKGSGMELGLEFSAEFLDAAGANPERTLAAMKKYEEAAVRLHKEVAAAQGVKPRGNTLSEIVGEPLDNESSLREMMENRGAPSRPKIDALDVAAGVDTAVELAGGDVVPDGFDAALKGRAAARRLGGLNKFSKGVKDNLAYAGGATLARHIPVIGKSWTVQRAGGKIATYLAGDVGFAFDGRKFAQEMTKRVHGWLSGKGGAAARRASALAVPLSNMSPAKKDKSATPHAGNYKARVEEIRTMMADPLQAEEIIVQNTAPLRAMGYETLANNLTEVGMRALNYLSTVIQPPIEQGQMFGGEKFNEPTQEEIGNLAEVMSVLDDPMSIFDGGPISDRAVEALEAVYPEKYAAIKAALVQELGTNNKNVPYDKRLELSVLFKAPFDSIVEILPELQETYALAEAEDQQEMQTQRSLKLRASVTATPGQRLSAASDGRA